MNSTRVFHPEMVSRRGEAILWTLTAVSLGTLIFLSSQGVGVTIWQMAFVLVMLLAAGGSSLSNWMDRNTSLTLEPEGLHFKNGLRDVSMTWAEVQTVSVFPSRFGSRINVASDQGHFNFRTMVETTTKGGARSVMGFAQGEFILQQILKNSGLQISSQSDKGRYYARS
jgi:hypothetical protein